MQVEARLPGVLCGRTARVVLACRRGALRRPAGHVEAHRCSRTRAGRSPCAARPQRRCPYRRGKTARRLRASRGGAPRKRGAEPSGPRRQARYRSPHRVFPARTCCADSDPFGAEHPGVEYDLHLSTCWRRPRARASTQGRTGTRRRSPGASGARQRATRRGSRCAGRTTASCFPQAASQRPRGAGMDLPRGGLGDAREPRRGSVADRGYSETPARARLLGGGETGCRERRRCRSHQPFRAGARARRGDADRSRRRPLAGPGGRSRPSTPETFPSRRRPRASSPCSVRRSHACLDSATRRGSAGRVAGARRARPCLDLDSPVRRRPRRLVRASLGGSAPRRRRRRVVAQAGTARVAWCARIFRFTRCSALSIVLVSQPSSSAIASYEWPSR